MKLVLWTALVLACLSAFEPSPAAAQSSADSEARTAAYMAKIADDPNALLSFLLAMPKGGDLHHHLTGAVYAESYIDYAVADGDCFDPEFTIVAPPCDVAKGLSPASRAVTDYAFRNLTINALSDRNFTPTPGDTSRLVHFFKTFFKFDLVTNGHWPQEFAEVVHRAAVQHVIYIETQLTPDKFKAIPLGEKVGWNDDFATMRARLDAAGMPALVAEGRANLDEAERGMRKILGCGGRAPDVGCSLTLRYQNQVLRALSKQAVFAQMLAGFEIANVDKRVLGLNIVEAQDDYTPMHDFELQMRMFDYLHHVYPKVHIDMHAGELFLGLTPPEEMETPSHIRDSIDIGHAERIGHGLDVLYEHDARGLLAQMARDHILVEDPIYIHELIGPGVVGRDVLPIYLNAGVPVSLATDDEGGARSNLTQTFERAVEGYHVTYPVLKRMVRDSLQHGFIEGADLWTGPEQFGHMTAACATTQLVAQPAAGTCATLLAASPKATLEWKEEVAFAEFERGFS
jgi:adenosine deaminase